MTIDVTTATQGELLAEAKRLHLTTDDIGIRVSRATVPQLREAITKRYTGAIVKLGAGSKAGGPGAEAARKRQEKATRRAGGEKREAKPTTKTDTKADPAKPTRAPKPTEPKTPTKQYAPGSQAVYEGRMRRGEQWPALAKAHGFGDNWRRARAEARKYAAANDLPDPQQQRGGPAPSDAIAAGRGRSPKARGATAVDAAGLAQLTEAIDGPAVFFRRIPGVGYEALAEGGALVDGQYEAEVLWTGGSLAQLGVWKREAFETVPKAVKLPDSIRGTEAPAVAS